MTPSTSALTGAAALNIPTLFAGSVVPAPTLFAAAVTLAAIGAALGWLAAWSFAADHQQVFELIPVRQEQDLREAA